MSDDFDSGAARDLVPPYWNALYPSQDPGSFLQANNPRPQGLDFNTALFGPGTPILPVWGEEKPREYQFPVGQNLKTVPRAGYGPSFPTLRNIGAVSKEVRLNIELIKRTIRSIEYDIIPTSKHESSAGADYVEGFFESPDGELGFDTWMSAAIEEMLVTDALTIYPDIGDNGEPVALDLIDGATIRPLINLRGRTPKTGAAYIQMLYGAPRWWGTKDAIKYLPFNPSVVSPYGVSPIEYFMLMISLALHRDTFHVTSFTAGNVPHALLGTPDDWSREDIDYYQKYLDGLISGKKAQQAKMILVPLAGGRGTVPVYEFRRDDITNTERDKWLLMIACWAFGNSPQEFGLTASSVHGGKGFVAGMEKAHFRSMIIPISLFFEKLFTSIIHKYFNRPNLKFKWLGLDTTEDAHTQSMIDDVYIKDGVYGPDYVAARLGIEAGERGQVLSPAAVAAQAAKGFGGGGESPMAKFFRLRETGWQDYG